MKAKQSSTLLCTAILAFAAHADVPGKHPAYLHAITDLRDARWDISHREGNAAVKDQERQAITEINHAIDEARNAAAADGKNVAADPREDAKLDHAGKLHHAGDLLRQAKSDISEQEDNPAARAAQRRAAMHVDAALQATVAAIRDVEQRK